MAKIWAHTIVKNEERFLWYSVMSVINHVDKILIWDTGSTDGTLEIIDAIRKTQYVRRKIEFREVGEVTPEEFTRVRQEMLLATDADWFIVVDGDEVWWEDSIGSLTGLVREKGKNLESIISPFINVVGDIYHYQEKQAGRYEIDGRRGHLSTRAINRKIPGLHLESDYPFESFCDDKGTEVHQRPKKLRAFLDKPFLHLSHLSRSLDKTPVLQRQGKQKHEIGLSFPLDFYYPEVFFRPRPKIVPSPWVKMDDKFKLRASIETPLRKIKRRVVRGKSGY